MSNILKRNSTIEVTVAASDKLAVFSKAAATISKYVGYPQFADSVNFVKLTVADIEYTTSAFSVETVVIIEAGNADVFYQAGTGPVITERRGLRGQGAPVAVNTTGAGTAAVVTSGMLAGIITSSTAAAVALTLPTFTEIEAIVDLEVGESVDWSVIVTGGNTLTVTAATGHTLVGTGAVVTVVSGTFRTRKSSATAYITYRLT